MLCVGEISQSTLRSLGSLHILDTAHSSTALLFIRSARAGIPLQDGRLSGPCFFLSFFPDRRETPTEWMTSARPTLKNWRARGLFEYLNCKAVLILFVIIQSLCRKTWRCMDKIYKKSRFGNFYWGLRVKEMHILELERKRSVWESNAKMQHTMPRF